MPHGRLTCETFETSFTSYPATPGRPATVGFTCGLMDSPGQRPIGHPQLTKMELDNLIKHLCTLRDAAFPAEG